MHFPVACQPQAAIIPLCNPVDCQPQAATISVLLSRYYLANHRRTQATRDSSVLAVLALRRFKANGLAIDPENPEHVKAYQVLRKNTVLKAAVNGKTLLAYVNNATPPVSHGAQSYVKY